MPMCVICWVVNESLSKVEILMLKTIFARIFTRENMLALALALIVTALVVFTADITPSWIYQGF